MVNLPNPEEKGTIDLFLEKMQPYIEECERDGHKIPFYHSTPKKNSKGIEVFKGFCSYCLSRIEKPVAPKESDITY